MVTFGELKKTVNIALNEAMTMHEFCYNPKFKISNTPRIFIYSLSILILYKALRFIELQPVRGIASYAQLITAMPYE